MALVFIEDLTEGMILADDLLTPKGRFVLAQGAPLTAEHLVLFHDWGIIEVDISEDSLGDEYHQQQKEIGQFVELAEGYLRQRFSLNNLKREPLTTIYRNAVHRLAHQLQQGWDPVSLTTGGLPEAIDSGEPALSVVRMLAGDVELVSLPTVYSHILTALNKADCSAYRLAEIIGKDTNLSMRLLKLVNSPLFGFSGKIESINRAVSLIGTDELSTLALGVTVVRQFSHIPSQLLNMDSFWRHSIRCGLYAKTFAAHLGLPGEESYFTGGMLHDIGRLIMLDQMPGAYARAVIKGRSEHLPMYRAELASLRADHASVGKLLAMRWRLPVALNRMIGGHHSPGTQFPIEACVVHVADILAHACGQDVNLVSEVPPLQEKAWEVTGLTSEQVAATIRQVDGEFRQIIKMFFG